MSVQKTKFKILVFAPYYPPHIGGLETHAAEFNQHLAARGHQIITFAPQLPANAPAKETKEKGKLTIIRYPAWEIIPNYPLPKFWSPTFWRLFRRLNFTDFDLVITRTRFFFSSFLGLLYAKFRRTKLVHIEHGSDFVRLNKKLYDFIARLYDYTIGKAIFKFSDLNIAISHRMVKFIQKFNPRPCPVIQRGIQIDKILAVPPDKKLAQQYKGYVIMTFVGRLIGTKAVDNLLIAFSSLLKKLPSPQKNKIILFVIGDGPEKKTLQNLARTLRINKQVKFWGAKPLPEVISLLKISDIFINPSNTEGLPTSVLEAGLCQNAIIATNVGGTNEIIQNAYNGYLIPPGSSQIIAEKMLALISSPDKMKLFGQKAQQTIKQKFNWKKSIQKYEKELAKLLAKK